MPAEPTDAELLRRHRTGDREAFNHLVRRHRNRMWAIALRTLGHAQDAEDALQNALLSAYRSADSYRGDAAVTTWLHRIVVNACLDLARRQSRHPTVELSQHTPGPTEDVTARETAMDLAAALGRLPLEQRMALVLVDVTGHPVDEAAALLGVPPGTVKSRCARGRARLAQDLGFLDQRNRSEPPDVRTEDHGYRG